MALAAHQTGTLSAPNGPRSRPERAAFRNGPKAGPCGPAYLLAYSLAANLCATSALTSLPYILNHGKDLSPCREAAAAAIALGSTT